MSRTTTHTTSFSKRVQRTYGRERRFFYAASSLIFILFGLYIYFVSMSVAHVVVRKELSQDIGEMQTRISVLESEFIMAQQAVDVEMALAQGFTAQPLKVFVEKADTALVLSRNDTR